MSAPGPVSPRTSERQSSAQITSRRLPPPWWRRLRNGTTRAAAARHDLPRDYASRIREVVNPFDVRVDVITNSRRIFEADLHGTEAQVNMACTAVIDFWESDTSSQQLP